MKVLDKADLVGRSLPLRRHRIVGAIANDGVQLVAVSEVGDARSDLRIQASFQIAEAGVALRVDTESPVVLQLAMDLVYRDIEDAFVNVDGTLSLTLEGGIGVEVPPTPGKTAWQFRSRNLLILCLPNSEVAGWGVPHRSKTSR